MANEQSLIPSPTEGESLEDYLRRISDAELHRIPNDPDLLTRFCHVLQECFRDFEQREDALEDLWKIIEQSNNLDSVLYFIRRLEPRRQHLLESLARNEEEIEGTYRISNFGRLLGSAVDIAGTVGGLMIRDSHPGYASWAFRSATAFGMLGLASALQEMNIMNTALNDLMREIAVDQEMIAPIQRWYHQTEELEIAMQKIFPFDVTGHISMEFSDAGNAEVSPIRLMTALIRSIAEQDVLRLRDEGLIRTLINFSLYPASQDWCEWLILRRHPVIMDITRMIVQLQSGSPLRFTMSQSISALSLADQNIVSFPVWGRIGLNVISIVDAIRLLSSSQTPSIVREMSHLRRHLQAEWNALQRIAEFIVLRRRKKKTLN